MWNTYRVQYVRKRKKQYEPNNKRLNHIRLKGMIWFQKLKQESLSDVVCSFM